MTGFVANRTETHLDLRIRVTPNAGQDALTGIAASADGQSHLCARVRAVPDKGKANAALIALLAKTWRVPKSNISVVRGATSRLKTIRIEAAKDMLNHTLEQVELLSDER